MSLAPGTTLGPYQVVAKLGEGGMGEVYEARDSKLRRSVALKILPPAFANDSDRLARFRREAQVLASLNHPNIAAIHGFEDSGAVHALVMELVPGRTLAETIRAPMPLSDALPVARQIAAALEAAHEQGIVHRDLKPANIKVTDDGTVKVLDFGLAKAMEPVAPYVARDFSPAPEGAEAGTGGAGLKSRATHDPAAYDPAADSPTMTSPAMTDIGVILGTAGYMAPEQAKGKPVDRRADIWALGVILFEMLSGRPLYRGETVTETIAHVITQPPDWKALPESVPAAVRRLLRRCLERDPRKRLQSAGDARIEIDEYLGGEPETPGVPAISARPAIQRWRSWLPWTVAAASIAALGVSLWPRDSTQARLVRLDVQLGDREELPVDDASDGAIAVLSPDGSMLAYLALVDGVRRLYLRPLDRLESTMVAGAEFAIQQFFSPDGRWLAFFAGGALRRVPVTGGAPFTITTTSDARGGTWGPDDTIVFTPGIADGLVRVPVSGGTPVAITTLGPNERTHRWPWFLPDGRSVLFMCQAIDGAYDDGTIEAVRLETGERKVLIRGGTFPRYVSSGHLLFTRQNTLYAVALDPVRVELMGEPQPIAVGIMSSGYGVGSGPGNGASQFAVSDDGTAVYIAGTRAAELVSQLSVVDRTGQTVYAFSERRPFRDPRFSPDGRRIAVRMSEGGSEHIHVLDPARDTLTRLTFEGTLAGLPIWSPDGRDLAYYSDRSGTGMDIEMRRSDGSGEPTPLIPPGTIRLPGSFSPDGTILAATELKPQGGDMDIIMVSTADGSLTPFLATPAFEFYPDFSPDGRWLAYVSADASAGLPEVYVRAYPGGGGLRQISSGGGLMPRWTKRGEELIYALGTPPGITFYAVDVDVDGDAMSLGRAERLFELALVSPQNGTWYDVNADGSRFAVLLADEADTDEPRRHVTVVFNFFDEIERALARSR